MQVLVCFQSFTAKQTVCMIASMLLCFTLALMVTTNLFMSCVILHGMSRNKNERKKYLRPSPSLLFRQAATGGRGILRPNAMRR